MLIHEAFHNQTHVGLSGVSLVLSLAVKEMLYLEKLPKYTKKNSNVR